MSEELIKHIESIVWDDLISDRAKVLAMQNLLYQAEQCRDHKTEQLFGDDDAHISKRKF